MLSKTLERLSNTSLFDEQTEFHMTGINKFIIESADKVSELLQAVSSPSKDEQPDVQLA